jgi:phosphoglycolate phosphatase-like HAD superfamily hydrolase
MRAFIFDLDGTLVDTVYPHVVALQQALAEAGVEVPAWLVHRRIGMSGGLSARALAREIGRALTASEQDRIQHRHGEIFLAMLPDRRPLPGARELVGWLLDNGVPFGVATSGRRPDIDRSLEVLGLPADVVVVSRGDVLRAKPEPDLFPACQERMGVLREDVYVVGDAVWDLLAARRTGMLSMGLLCGGYSLEELVQAGALRVYRGPRELLGSLDELGFTGRADR